MASTLPSLVPTKAKVQTFGNVAYHVGAEATPVLTVDVSKTSVFFNAGDMLWKHSSVKLTLRPHDGGGRLGLPAGHGALAEASGKGMIAFSRNRPGRVAALHMVLGRQIEVRAHHFLAATKAISHVAHGRGVDVFHSDKGDGVLWVYADGLGFEQMLKAGDSIDVQPGAWVYKEQTVGLKMVTERAGAGRFGVQPHATFHRFTGPGRLGVQSMGHAGDA